MARLDWSLASQRDLEEIADFIAKDSVIYALSVIDRLVAAAETLPPAPRSGRVVPEYRREDLRELIVGNYRLVYLVRADGVAVVRIVHGARNFERVLGPEPWRRA